MKNLIQIGDKPSQEAMEQATSTYKEILERYNGDVVEGVQIKLDEKQRVKEMISKELSTKEIESNQVEKNEKQQEDELDR